MPQLNTIFIFMIFLWTWSMLYSMMKKTIMLQMTTTPKNHPTSKTNEQTLTMPWT